MRTVLVIQPMLFGTSMVVACANPLSDSEATAVSAVPIWMRVLGCEAINLNVTSQVPPSAMCGVVTMEKWLATLFDPQPILSERG